MKIGDYVRYENGEIEKIHSFAEKDNPLFNILINSRYYNADEIEKYGELIDLLEESDLVVIEYYSLRYKERVARLFEVDYKDKEFIALKNYHCDFVLRNNEFSDKDKKLKPIIKSIITKEQIESIKYEVE